MQYEVTKKIPDMPFWQVVAVENGSERVVATCPSEALAEFVKDAVTRAERLGVVHLPPKA